MANVIHGNLINITINLRVIHNAWRLHLDPQRLAFLVCSQLGGYGAMQKLSLCVSGYLIGR